MKAVHGVTMGMTMPYSGAVGILIPTYNRKQYLETALTSALGQSFARLEVIVIDNGSTDGTAELMAGMTDPRTRYVVNDRNLGMIGSINKGILLFPDHVEWCTVLGDDDLLDKDFIGNLLNAAASAQAKSIVHSHRVLIDRHGTRLRDAAPAPPEESALEYLKMRSQFRRETYLTGVLFSRRAFVSIGGYPSFLTGLSTDDAFIFALALQDRLICDHRALAYVRIHGDAESRDFSDSMTKLQTFAQFEAYCRRVAKESGRLDPHQYREFDAVLSRYVRTLCSFWWLESARYELRRERKDNLFPGLISFVQENPDRVSFRVKLAARCQRITGFYPETYAWYRACWDGIIRFSQLVQKALHPAGAVQG